MVHTQTLTPSTAVVISMHHHGAGGQMRRYRVVVLFSPGLQELVLGLWEQTQILQMKGLVYRSADYKRADESRDDDNRVACGIVKEGFLEAVLVNVLRIY